jgi:hypothetical protein
MIIMAKSKSTKTKKARPAGATELLPVSKKAGGKIQNDERTSSLMKHPHPSSTRSEIRALEHRTMGSRQSKKPAERSNQRRQPKTGGAGGHGNAGRADRTARTTGKKK